ncbi:SDR family oxidoreductase [Tabrizicola piscis]|uniref:SDR family oxidoreductase n=1 Tax=Tabrizicola piscis TaxID=2494374 RepID=A0A3S8U6R4_9RHOB|nr:SDR family oxidoreductase [Tabrizicola piscis]AZL59336.1 SDR family oxidoreductase [Tabrizicola piscis]
MKLGLEDKAVVVTGAASGIGAAIVRLLAAEGVGALVLVDRDGDGAGRMAASLSVPGEVVVADLTDPATPATVAAAAKARFGRIDGLVNAAGLTTRGSVATGQPEVWDSLFAVNARAAFFLMQASVNDMLARGAAGSIVNILSMNALCGSPDLAIYAASKGALATLTRNAAHAHMADRIRVNGINLGWVATESERRMQADQLGHGAGWLAKAEAAMPLGRLVTAEECARLAVFLLGDASVPMSGALIDLEQKVVGGL